ncbi:hypothetical protein NMG60_11022641 [Bertholletia excelsa]
MNDSISQIHPSAVPMDTPNPTVPPLPHRRPRVREVSSRFMSSSVVSSSSSPLPRQPVTTPNPSSEVQSRQQQQRSKSVQRRCQDAETLCHADENIPDTTLNLETPVGLRDKAVTSTQRKPRAAAVKILKENGDKAPEQQPIISSRFRLDRPTAAAKLLQSTGMSLSAQHSNPHAHVIVNGDTTKSTPYLPLRTSSDYDTTGDNKAVTQIHSRIPTSTNSNSTNTAITCTSTPTSTQNSKARSLPDLRSSMPEADALPTLSTRLLTDRNCSVSDTIGCDSSKSSSSPCSRSLNLPLSGCEHSSLIHTFKASEKTPSVLSKQFANSSKLGSLCLPPIPCPKQGADLRRGRKVVGHQEEVHTLKLLHNHYLQWRYANAKAEASIHTKRKETEKQLYSLGVYISALRDTVKRKRIELWLLQRITALTTILEAQMPHLDKWSSLEGEYSCTLSEATHALLNASIQLPVSGNVKVDIKEVEEALNSAIKVVETISFNIQNFLPKAEEMEALALGLARVSSGERTLIEETGHLLFKTYTTQVEECSLRGHLIQSYKSHRGHDLKEG